MCLSCHNYLNFPSMHNAFRCEAKVLCNIKSKSFVMDQPLDLSVQKSKSVIIPAAQQSSKVTLKVNKSFLQCKVCNKYFDRPSLLKRHSRTHTGEKPHICETCNKGFSTSSSLNTHRRIHSGLKPHVCGHCGKRFTASSNLYYHKMTHTKVKPHKCNLCPKSFPTPGDLKSHMHTHNGSWPFRCCICHRGFSKATNLKNHLIIHTGEKPHSCVICSKRFALPCNLRAHVKLHEEGVWINQKNFNLFSMEQNTCTNPENSALLSNYLQVLHHENVLRTLFQINYPKLFTLHAQNYVVHLH